MRFLTTIKRYLWDWTWPESENEDPPILRVELPADHSADILAALEEIQDLLIYMRDQGVTIQERETS